MSTTPLPLSPVVRVTAELRDLLQLREPDDILQRALELAVGNLDGIAVADIMFVRTRRVSSPMSTDPLAEVLTELQDELGQGPCLSTLADDDIVVSHELATDERFAQFGERASRLGVQSVAAFRLFAEPAVATYGAMNLYRSEVGVDPVVIDIGAIIAATCSTILRSAIDQEGLRQALESRDVIGQAKGILMERHRCTADQAFMAIRQRANDLNLKVRDVAEVISQTGMLPDG